MWEQRKRYFRTHFSERDEEKEWVLCMYVCMYDLNIVVAIKPLAPLERRWILRIPRYSLTWKSLWSCHTNFTQISPFRGKRFTFYGSALKLFWKKCEKSAKSWRKRRKVWNIFPIQGKHHYQIYIYILLQKESIFALSRKFEKVQNFFLKGFPVKWNPQ